MFNDGILSIFRNSVYKLRSRFIASYIVPYQDPRLLCFGEHTIFVFDISSHSLSLNSRIETGRDDATSAFLLPCLTICFGKHGI